jgi:antitoxin ParD1/3/4
MSNLREISIALSAEALAVIEEAVETGEYASASDVVREALRNWKDGRSAQREPSADELRQLWREGMESGDAVEAAPVFERLQDKFRRMATRKG